MCIYTIYKDIGSMHEHAVGLKEQKEHVSTDSSFGNFNGVMPTKSFADTYNMRRRNFVKDIHSTLCYRTIRYFSIKTIKRIDVYVPKLRLFAK
ncbi:uncharacterized protein LOC122570586 isoform X2 [Bombus pyrosoma]|uniref:uncharacterized protein LOC122570586 isoform X2 n=1 Tax=Bombus pyrosoma TaxID=396416 RepID=UPI001CB9826F|nr:uncharacterized protein LOC122570586 isoform X2 [Bombus pyrosoma]